MQHYVNRYGSITQYTRKELDLKPILGQRGPEIDYHFTVGKLWLDKSAYGLYTAELCYAAFEFRLQIERIGLQHWSALKPGGFETIDLLNARKFKTIENQIYKLAGNQRELDLRYEFARILLNLLKINSKIATPQLGKLSSYWQECSELCHIASSFGLTNPELAKIAYDFLVEVCDFLGEQLEGLNTIGRLPDCSELERKFIAGEITSEDVKSHIAEIGIWARVEYEDSRPNEFIGEAIPPAISAASGVPLSCGSARG